MGIEGQLNNEFEIESKYKITYAPFDDKSKIKECVCYADCIKDAMFKARTLLAIKGCKVIKVKYLGKTEYVWDKKRGH